MENIVENFVENEDGSATITMSVDDSEQQFLMEKGLNFMIIESLFNTNVSEIIELLKTARGENNDI